MMISKAKNWWRERRERIAEKKAARAALQSEHGHGRFFLLNVPAAATILAAFVEVYWALLFCIEATGHLNGNFDMAVASASPLSFIWDFAFSGNLFVLLGLLAATAPIVMISMVWLPVQFAMRGFGRWRRGTLIAVGLMCNAIVIISGTVVMNHNRQEQVREALSIEQQAGQNRAAIQAQIDAVQADLERLADRRVNNEYAATAANVGAAAYRAQYMSEEALARSPAARRDIIVRALGAAERADALRAERTALIGQLASAPTAADVAPQVEDRTGAGLNAFSEQVKVYRPPLIAVTCTAIGILGAWWTLAMMMGLNPRDVLRSGWADESHRIEDHSEEAPIEVDPRGMQPAREVVTDAETGEELVKVKPKEYWRRRVPKKGKPTKVQVEPEILPDETGVAEDGGQRTARGPITAAGPLGMELAAQHGDEHSAQKAEQDEPDSGAVITEDGGANVSGHPEDRGDSGHPEQSDEVVFDPETQPDSPSEAAIDAYMALADAPVEADDVDENTSDGDEPDQGEQYDLPDGGTVTITDEEPEREPETRPGRMIAAE